MEQPGKGGGEQCGEREVLDLRALLAAEEAWEWIADESCGVRPFAARGADAMRKCMYICANAELPGTEKTVSDESDFDGARPDSSPTDLPAGSSCEREGTRELSLISEQDIEQRSQWSRVDLLRNLQKSPESWPFAIQRDSGRGFAGGGSSGAPSLNTERLLVADRAFRHGVLGFAIALQNAALSSAVGVVLQPSVNRFVMDFRTCTLFEVGEVHAGVVMVKRSILMRSGDMHNDYSLVPKSIFQHGVAPLIRKVTAMSLRPCEFCLWRDAPLCDCLNALRLRQGRARLHRPDFFSFCELYKANLRTFYSAKVSIESAASQFIKISSNKVLLGAPHGNDPFMQVVVDRLDPGQAVALLQDSHFLEILPGTGGSPATKARKTKRPCNLETSEERCTFERKMMGASTKRTRATFVCLFCNWTSTSKAAYTRHLAAEHADEATGSSRCCDICGTEFTTPTNMYRHKRTAHFGIRDYTCIICDKSFVSKDKLNRHFASSAHISRTRALPSNSPA
mmetsp:Transcript_15592/g.41984  ORF Transcript_15592/g.41984 Transcript_15592/m.41984 type:complete len:510 (+) Transcript_15592:16-1545(+)